MKDKRLTACAAGAAGRTRHRRTMHLWHRRVNRSAGGTVGIWVFLVLMGMAMALPLYYAVVSSFKPFDEFFLYPPKFVALNPTWNNYRELFGFFANSMMSFWRYVFNSVFVVVCCTVLHVLFSSMAAYPLAKNEFHGKKLIFSTVVVALLFVPQVTFLTQYVVIEKLGLLNTYGALIFPYIGTSLGLFLMKQFMEQIPQSVLEAARIDGSSEYGIWWRIVMPNVKPAWLTLIIFVFQSAWANNGQMVIYDESLKMLPSAISQILSTGSTIARQGAGMASTVFMMIPPILLFVFSQSRIIATMAHAGIKE